MVTDRIRRALKRSWVLPAALAIGFLLVQLVLAPQLRMYPDTARYAELALTYRGVPAAEAHATVLPMLCADVAEQAVRDSLPGYPVDPVGIEQSCLIAQAEHFVPTGDPRYAAIFQTRPAYPAIVSVLSTVVGLKPALWAVPVLATALAGLFVWSLLRRLAVGRHLAAAGQVLLYVLPIGWWGSQMLTEGLVLLAVLVVVVGGVKLMDGERGGQAFLLGGFAALGAIKSSTGALLAVAFVATAAVGWFFDQGRRRAWLHTGAGSLVSAAVLLGVPAARGWPGLDVSLQDLLTGHFHQPDVPDVWMGWLAAIQDFVVRWPAANETNLVLLIGTPALGWILWLWHRPTALVVAAVGATAVGSMLVHPSLGEASRLYTLAWMVVVVGLPVAVRLVPQDVFSFLDETEEDIWYDDELVEAAPHEPSLVLASSGASPLRDAPLMEEISGARGR